MPRRKATQMQTEETVATVETVVESVTPKRKLRLVRPMPEEVPEWSAETHILLVADGISSLRSRDMDRLFRECPAEHLKTLGEYILEHRPELKTKVMSTYCEVTGLDSLKEFTQMEDEPITEVTQVEESPVPEEEPVAEELEPRPQQPFVSFSISQSDLAKILPDLNAITSSAPHPVLKNLLFKVDPQRNLKLIAFNLTLGVQISIAVDYYQLEKTMEFCIPAQLLTSLVMKLPEESLDFEYDSNEGLLKISSSVGTYFISNSGFEADGFPDFPQFSEVGQFAMTLAMIQEGFERTEFSCSNDERQMVLCGVNLEIEDKGNKGKDINPKWLKFASTDGHRLSIYKQSADIDRTINATIPPKALKLVTTLFNKGAAVTLRFEQDVAVDGELFSGGFVEFAVGRGDRLIARLVDGQYPNYEPLIPTQFKWKAEIERGLLLKSIERCLLFRDVLTLSFDYVNQKVKVGAAMERNQGDEWIKLDLKQFSENEEKFDISFNGKYLYEAVKYSSAENFVLEMNAPTSPALVTDGHWRHLIMPVQVRS